MGGWGLMCLIQSASRGLILTPMTVAFWRKLQNKLEVDLLNIVQLKLALRREESSLVNPPPALFHFWAEKHNPNTLL